MKSGAFKSLDIFWAYLLLALITGCGPSHEHSNALSAQTHRSDIAKRLAELGIVLKTSPQPPSSNRVKAVRTGNLVFLAGHGPAKPDGGFVTGKMGRDLDVEAGRQAARLSAISLLSSLQSEILDLDKVKRIVRIFGMVNATPDFVQQSQVIDGCSDLLVSIFGEKGKHARAAVGMSSLPRNFAVEIEMLVEIGE